MIGMHVLSGIAGVLLRLRCPHCHERQTRARKPRGSGYACRRCHRHFTREQGLAEDAARPRRRRATQRR
jgi:transposase-like protein